MLIIIDARIERTLDPFAVFKAVPIALRIHENPQKATKNRIA